MVDLPVKPQAFLSGIAVDLSLLFRHGYTAIGLLDYLLSQLQMNFFRQIDRECEDLERFRCARFLSFLPVRDQPVTFSPSSLANVLKQLSCPICKETMSSPVYLKCSHRFCRQCIEKHTRGTMKRSCPVCLTPLVLKRDLKTDDVAIDLVDILTESLTVQAKFEEPGRESGDLLGRGRRKRQRTKLQAIQLDSEIDQPKKRPDNPLLIEPWNQPESGYQSSSAVDTFHQSALNAKVEFSSAQEEVQQSVKYQSNFNNLNYSIQGYAINDQPVHHCASEQPSNSSSDQLEAPQQLSLSHQPIQPLKKQQDSPSISGQSQNSALPLPSSDRNVSAYFRLKLVPQPNKIFTPVLGYDEILVPSEAQVSLVAKFIATSLNIFPQQVRLLVRDNGQFREVSSWQGLSQLNHLYWLADQEIAMLSLQQMLIDLTLSGKPRSRFQHSCLKTLFFSIDFQKRPPQRRPKY